MIPGIEDDDPTIPEGRLEAPPARNMVRVSLGFYHYLQECADLVSAISTDQRPYTRHLALEWKIAARAIQHTFGKIDE